MIICSKVLRKSFCSNTLSRFIRSAVFVQRRSFHKGHENCDHDHDHHDHSHPPHKNQNKETEAVMGLEEYKLSTECFQKGDFQGAEKNLKEALRILKSAQQEKSVAYLFLLNKLAFCTFKSNKYADSERYFKVAEDITKLITSNPLSLYNAQKNLIILYLNSDIAKAENKVKEIMESQDTPLIAKKEVYFFNGTVKLLKEEFADSDLFYNETLKCSPSNTLRGYTLHNMATASWLRATNSVEDIQKDEAKSEEQKHNESLSKFSEAINLYKDAIASFEDLDERVNNNYTEDVKLLEQLLDKSAWMPQNVEKEHEDKFFNILTNVNSGLSITNIADCLFYASSKNSRIPAFWFRLGLKFYEQRAPHLIDKHLILLAMFYASNKQFMIAEGLYRDALGKLEKSNSYNRVMCLNMFGRMLMKVPKRTNEATKLLIESEELAKQLPYWFDKMTYVHIPEFVLS